MNKREFRKQAIDLRATVTRREEKSLAIWERLFTRFPWPDLGWVCSYVDIEPEVITRPYLQERIDPPAYARSGSGSPSNSAKLVVPYCLPQHLNLFHLRDWSQLTETKWGLQEPAPHLRQAENLVEPNQIDLFLVPGVAFDRRGNRLGYGKGYYDKLLVQRRPDCLAVALAFQIQIADEIPHDPAFDVPMDYIVTEQELIDCRAQR
ncbi:MAG: 5-formyltetrahydrofolate cyclo-ligase [Pirellulaceae bacterium]|nr:5-formyltetrahydrofolate cyclo-ligase [Pirellulaceae bacterium]